MKKLILLCFLLSVFCTGIFSQNLIRADKLWVNSWGTLGTAGPPPYFVHSNMCKIDTNAILLNNHQYSTLMYTTDSLGLQWQNYGYLRETENGKVYYVKSLSDTAEKLCYDFGASIGDTISVYNIGWGSTNPVHYAISNIDSTFFAGQMRKRLFYGWEEWISGVGSKLGLIYNGWQVVGVLYHLNCYFENDTLLYHNELSPTCFFEYVGIENPNTPENSFCRIFPNPVSGFSTVNITADIRNDQDCNFELYSSLGQLVASLPARTLISLARNDFKPGLYYYRLISKSRLYTSGKVVIN